MKKCLLILLAVLFVFSCKVSPNSSRGVNLSRIQNAGGSRSDEDDFFLGDESIFTNYADENNAILFVSDDSFNLTLVSNASRNNYKSIENLDEYEFSSELEYVDEYEFSSGFSDGKIVWKSLKEHYGVKPDIDINPDNASLQSIQCDDVINGKNFLFIRGYGNKRFGFTFKEITDSDTCKIACYGDVINLLDSGADKEDFKVWNAAFSDMFANAKWLVHAPSLSFKNTNSSCCSNMFKNCTSLTKAPALPAVNLAEFCYESMFKGCTSLTQAPELPAEYLGDSCYESMFEDCTSLVSASELPATRLREFCYESMFKNCTSLASTPKLPATDLAKGCYYFMFKNCTSLTQAPDLLAESIAKDAYKYMFDGCSMLEDIPYILANNLEGLSQDDYSLYSMFRGCNKISISEKKDDIHKYPFVVYIDMKSIFGDYGVNGLKDLLKDTVYYKATKFGDQNYTEPEPTPEPVPQSDPYKHVKDENSKAIIQKYNIPLIANTSIPRIKGGFGMNEVSFRDGRIKDKFPKYTEYTENLINVLNNDGSVRLVSDRRGSPYTIVKVEYQETEESSNYITEKTVCDYYYVKNGDLNFWYSEGISCIYRK